MITVGNGKPHHAENFRNEIKMISPLYVDPKLGCYKAMNLKSSIWRTFGPMAWLQAFRAYRKGYRVTGVTGDPWQQGGTFVVLPNGQVPYHYICKHAGDHPDPNEFISVLATAVKQ